MLETFISFHWNNDKDWLKIGLEHLNLHINKRNYHYGFSELQSVNILTKKKLAPLVSGAILSSLAMVNILLEGASLYMIGFLSVGLLILYFGLTDYWVIQINHTKDTNQFWVSKSRTPQFPTNISNVVHFRITQGLFPPLYCSVLKKDIGLIVAEKNQVDPQPANPSFSLLPPKQQPDYIRLKIDASKLSMPIHFVAKSEFLAMGSYKINQNAILDMEV